MVATLSLPALKMLIAAVPEGARPHLEAALRALPTKKRDALLNKVLHGLPAYDVFQWRNWAKPLVGPDDFLGVRDRRLYWWMKSAIGTEPRWARHRPKEGDRIHEYDMGERVRKDFSRCTGSSFDSALGICVWAGALFPHKMTFKGMEYLEYEVGALMF